MLLLKRIGRWSRVRGISSRPYEEEGRSKGNREDENNAYND